MNKFFLIVLLGFLTGCSPAERPPNQAAGSGAMDSASTEQTNQPDGYNEYLWCQHGANYSSQSFSELMEDWTTSVNNLGMSELGHSTLMMRGEGSENFDSIVVLRWTDKEARDSGWASYQAEDVDASLQAKHPDVIACGGDGMQQHLWGFNRYQQPAAVQWDRAVNPAGLVGYRFCSFAAEKSAQDLATIVRGPFSEYINASDPSSYSYAYLDPDFDPSVGTRHEGVPTDYDFAWMNFWGDPSQKGPSDELWAEQGQEIQAAFDEVATCSEEQLYDVTSNKMPSSLL